MGTPQVALLDNDDSSVEVLLVFPFKAEWKILRHHEKWTSYVSQTPQKHYNKTRASSEISEVEAEDVDVKP